MSRRYALSMTAMLLLLLGATLAMLLRDSPPLVTYTWAFLPSILDILLISGGDHMVRRGLVFALGAENIFQMCASLFQVSVWFKNYTFSILQPLRLCSCNGPFLATQICVSGRGTHLEVDLNLKCSSSDLLSLNLPF